MELWAILCVLLAVPGLISSSLGPWPARLAAALALCALWVAATDPQAPGEEQRPPRVALATTAGPVDEDASEALRSRGDPSTSWSSHDSGTLAARLQSAGLAAGPRASELLLAWTGPAAPPPEGADPLARPFVVLSATSPLPLDPEAVWARAETALAVGRPALLSFAATGLTGTTPATVRIVAPDDEEVLHEEILLRPGGTSTLALSAEVEGDHRVELELRIDGARIRRHGTLAVAPAPRVLVVGQRAAELAPALQVQGLRVETAASLPGTLGEHAAVVLLEAITIPQQEALARAVDDGLGLFLTGPALPAPGEPLEPVLPVRPEPGPPSAGDQEGTGDEPGPPAPPPDEPSVEPEEPTEPPPPDPSTPPPDRPPTGETGDAEPDPEASAEVERRSVAMVLVVDRSWSMGDPVRGAATKMDYAKRSAYETARALTEGDLVGIVTFGSEGAARVELPLTSANDERMLRESTEGLSHAYENTYLASALRKAGEMLQSTRLPVKHVVVISDGQFHDAPLVLPAIAGQLRAREKATVSVIQVLAGEPNPLWVKESNEIVQRGGGALHLTRDPTKIPMLVSLEVTRALDRVGRKPAGAPSPNVSDPTAAEQPPDRPAEEPPETPAQPEPKVPETADLSPPESETPTPDPEPEAGRLDIPVRAVSASVLLEPRPDSWPPVGGFVPSRGAFDAQVLLVAGNEGRPLLAFANRGLGRVAAWTSDLAGAWSGAWRADPAFPGRFAAWVQSLLPPLPVPAAPNLLERTEVEPPRPTPPEIAALAAWSGGPVRNAGDYRPPGPRREVRHRGQARDLAAWAVAALLLLALVECLAGRLGPGTRGY